MKIFDSLRISFAGMFKGQRQTIKKSTNVVAAQSSGGPATAGITITPVIEKIVTEPAESVEEIEKKIARMVESQKSTAGTKPAGILIDEREFNVLMRDLKPGESRGLLAVSSEPVMSYESLITYDGFPVNRIAGLGLGKADQDE